MKIKPEAEASASSGVPTYCVTEDDRPASWTITTKTLLDMELWDGMNPHDRGLHLTSGSWRTWVPVGYLGEALTEHAVVARRALRAFLGLGPCGATPNPKKWGDGLRAVPITESPSCHIFAEVGDRGDGTGRIGRRVIISLGDPHQPYQWHFGPWMNDAEATALAAHLLPIAVPAQHPPAEPIRRAGKSPLHGTPLDENGAVEFSGQANRNWDGLEGKPTTLTNPNRPAIIPSSSVA